VRFGHRCIGRHAGSERLDRLLRAIQPVVEPTQIHRYPQVTRFRTLQAPLEMINRIRDVVLKLKEHSESLVGESVAVVDLDCTLQRVSRSIEVTFLHMDNAELGPGAALPGFNFGRALERLDSGRPAIAHELGGTDNFISKPGVGLFVNDRTCPLDKRVEITQLQARVHVIQRIRAEPAFDRYLRTPRLYNSAKQVVEQINIDRSGIGGHRECQTNHEAASHDRAMETSPWRRWNPAFH